MFSRLRRSVALLHNASRARSFGTKFAGLSRTLGAEGFPNVNARYIPDDPEPLPMPTADNRCGTPSEKHWDTAEWSDAELREAAVDNVMLSWSNSAPVESLPFVTHGEGVYLYDSTGKQYLDWTSQAVCVNLGYTIPAAVRQAINKQLDDIPYVYGGMGLVSIRVKLAKLMAELAPGDINGFLFPSGGSEANEAAIRIARLYSGKQKVLTQYRSYHGGSAAALSATGDFRRFFAEAGASGFVKMFNPQPIGFSWGATDESACERALMALEEQICAEGPGSIAAIMLESIVGAGGVLVPPAGYMQGVRALCNKYAILLICDEVMVGFGRTGEFFGFQHFEGVIPDIVTSAKGLTGSYLPLSLVGVRQHIKDFFWSNRIGWGATYHAHPVPMACAYETVKYMIDHDIVGRVRNLEPVMFSEIQRLVERHPCVRQGRAIGLFGCLDIVNRDGRLVQKLSDPMNEQAVKLKQAFLANGLISLFRPPLLHCSPPLVISEAELRDGFRRVSKSLTVLDEDFE